MSGAANPDYTHRINAPWQDTNRHLGNPLTPEILLRGLYQDTVAWELSRGQDFTGIKEFFGVTFLFRVHGEWEAADEEDSSGLFATRQESYRRIVEVCRRHAHGFAAPPDDKVSEQAEADYWEIAPGEEEYDATDWKVEVQEGE